MKSKKTMIKIITALAIGVSMYGNIQTVKAAPLESVTRIGGQDRFETAIEVSNKFVSVKPHHNAHWKGGEVDTVILANAFNYPDALAAAPLTKVYNAPILLSGNENLEPKTETQIKKLGIKKVIMIGGTGVLSENVENKLKELGIETERIGGQDRYETSMKIAKKLTNVHHIVLTTTSNFTDALSVAPVAIRAKAPIILVPEGQDIKIDDVKGLREYVNNITDGNSEPNTDDFRATVIGSEKIISDDFFNLPNSRGIGAGNIYFDNFSVNYSRQEFLTFDNVIMASTIDFADALSGTALSAKLNAPIVFAGGDNDIFNNDIIKNKFLGLYGVTDKVYLLGGPAVVAEGAEHKIGK